VNALLVRQKGITLALPHRVKRTFTVALALTAAVACGPNHSQRFAPAVQRSASSTPRWVHRDALGRRLWALEQKFYGERQHVPAWIDGDEPTAQLHALVGALGDAEMHGLAPAAYGSETLAAALQKADDRSWFGAAFEPDVIPEMDLRLTYAFLRHAADLLGWRSSPREVARSWVPSPKKADLLQHLRDALKGNRVREVLDGIAPSHAQYKGLQAALARARKGSGEHLDLQKISINLERWRWAPRELGERYMLINVPSYSMQVIEGGKPVLAMRVIVGAPDTPTPLFSDQMTYVVFSPYWNIPESILRAETLPRLAEDPDFLSRNDIEVVDTSGEVVDVSGVDWSEVETTEGFRFRQAPGSENALGLVKFIFPNHFSVYLHDTPTDSLFNKEKRTFSHGCIRIENPVALAEYVLQDRKQWTPERIRHAMSSGREQSVKLKTAIPVHIGYWTAWVEEDGSVTHLDDPYALDQRQEGMNVRRSAAR
jgi:murein L,D-transpeptidase YcbB/YkuD